MNRHFKRAFVFGCLVVFSLTFPAIGKQDIPRESAVILTNSTIVELVEAGFSAQTIIRRIKQSRCHFDTNASQLAELKSRGVPDSVLRAMTEAPYGMSAGQKQNDNQGSSRKTGDASDDPTSIAVQVPEGTFMFQKLRLRGESYSVELVGEIVNKTNKTWSNVEFKVVGIDANGNEIENGFDLLNDISVFGLKVGETQTISKSLSGFDRKPPSRVVVTFRDGEYPAEYTFALINREFPTPSLMRTLSFRLHSAYHSARWAFYCATKPIIRYR